MRVALPGRVIGRLLVDRIGFEIQFAGLVQVLVVGRAGLARRLRQTTSKHHKPPDAGDYAAADSGKTSAAAAAEAPVRAEPVEALHFSSVRKEGRSLDTLRTNGI